jgi:hypothetical protein
VPSRINHIKVVCPNPHIVNAFLTQVCDIPEGWPLAGAFGGDRPPRTVSAEEPLGPGGDVTMESILAARGYAGAGAGGGFITGDASSRQFQIISGEPADVWGLCVSTRYIEDVYERAVARGVPCTPITVADFNERDDIRNFFCIVDGITFEVIRVEPKEPGQQSTSSAE